MTDVCDGMDLVGLQDMGLMHNSIRPLWRDEEQFDAPSRQAKGGCQMPGKGRSQLRILVKDGKYSAFRKPLDVGFHGSDRVTVVSIGVQ